MDNVPSELFECASIHNLTLCVSDVKAYEKIGKLYHLRHLTVGRGTVPNLRLPYSVKYLLKLKQFNLIHANLDSSETLFRRLASIPNLSDVSFYNYECTSNFPTGVSELTQIKSLSIANYRTCVNCKTMSISDEIHKLRNLHWLEVCMNQLYRRKVNSDEYELAINIPNCDIRPYNTCLSENSTILMSTGEWKLITEVVLGDSVLVPNVDSVYSTIVTGIEKHVCDEDLPVHRVQVDSFGELLTIDCTHSHPLFTADGSWKAIDELKIGDEIQLIDSAKNTVIGEIKSITKMNDLPDFVYNLKTGSHVYVANRFISHNK